VAGPPSEDGTADPIARMRALWEEVLGALEIEPDDNFFDIGGTSLSAIELVARIRDEFGADLSIAALLDAPTLEGLTRSVAG
jgi:enterobactin synthetase component F